MFGEAIIARSIDAAQITDTYGNRWQYHSRSDRHSKVACWSVLFDLLNCCSLLRDQIAAGKVAFGINHEMRDFKQDRKKNLDLVLCRRLSTSVEDATFVELGAQWGVVLGPNERSMLQRLPIFRRGAVSNVLLALEAKACMTEHGKALPRLHDELASAHQTVHGDTGGAIAAGYVIVNSAESFVSPDRNRKKIRGANFVVNRHQQPGAAAKTLAALMKIPRRSDDKENGFDGLGVTMVRCANDRSAVVIDEMANETISDIVRYGSFLHRLAHLYSTKFGTI